MKEVCTLKGIQIKNFRSLKDTGILNLSPITVLVGENSSGKSTFLRAFPLIKQSISKRTSGPLLWAGDIDDYVDFGSFEETVTNDFSDSISFKFSFPLIYNRQTSYLTMGDLDAIDREAIDIEYELTVVSNKGKDSVSAIRINVNGIITTIDLVRSTIYIDNYPILIEKKIVDGVSQVTDETEKAIRFQSVLRSYISSSSIFDFTLPDISSIWTALRNRFCYEAETQQFDYGITLFNECIKIVGELLCRGKSMTESLTIIRQRAAEEIYYSPIALRAGKIITAIKKESEKNRDKYQAFIKACFIYSVFSQIEEYVTTYFNQVHYIAPLRATAERYYRLRNLAVDEVDYQGKNLAIYLNSLSQSRLNNFNKWAFEHFGFRIRTSKDGGHLSIKIQVDDTKAAINLSDTGFGYSQILPIITQLWELASRKKKNNQEKEIPLVIAIEQPELHLHPAVQAKLAKAFIASIRLAEDNGYRLQLLLETHSETMINYFGKAIAKGTLDAEDISVILFEKKLNSEISTVIKSGFDREGYMLASWPYGFFAPGE